METTFGTPFYVRFARFSVEIKVRTAASRSWRDWISGLEFTLFLVGRSQMSNLIEPKGLSRVNERREGAELSTEGLSIAE